jgi:hypothetical protein
MTPKRTSPKGLLKDERIEAWHTKMATGSRRTADGAVQKLGAITKALGLSPQEIVDLAGSDPRKLEGILVGFVVEHKKRGLKPSYTAVIISALKAWLASQHVPFDGYPNIRQHGGETVIGERVPTVEELQRLLDAIPTARGKVVALSMAHAGLRPGTLGTYRGETEALRLRNLPELDIDKLEFRKIPFLIEVPGSISKNGVTYVTFGSKALADRIVEYLRERRGVQTVFRRKKGDGGHYVPTRQPGETLTADSPLVTGGQYENLGHPVSEKAIMVELSSAIARSKPTDVSWVPYVLRSFASTRLWEASMEGAIDFQTREAILGHNAGVSALYSSRRKLEPQTIEKMRAAYERCGRFFWQATAEDKEERLRQMNVQFLRLAGYTAQDAETLSQGKSTDEIGKLAHKKLGEKLGASAEVRAQRFVEIQNVKERDALAAQGWTVRTAAGTTLIFDPPN